jgi:hypothetical protein
MQGRGWSSPRPPIVAQFSPLLAKGQRLMDVRFFTPGVSLS